ncbi:uncharacterized protein LOC125061092 isoform X7 [Pieris napi]|uniref:uncharacterized protein LOC125061092 isoform X7 n=1 Tax=Pieris napi TaxID=78633 RepID=UPI001FB95AC8|nr:uncharacterized protein LOC125061092 isoform X7 [Pieris napi]
MDNDGRKCRKTKLVPREVNESDEEIFALQSVVESTLARIKRPCKKALPVVAIATQSSQTNTNSIRENPGRSNTMPMNFDIKIEVENVDENAIEKQHEIISWREIVKKSNEIYLQSNNICDKILHGQVLNTCKPDVKVFVKTPHEKLLDRVFTRWCDWASLTEEPKDPPLFYKCYICDMAWWHLADFRDHIRTHEPSSLRVVLEMNDYVECNIVAYYSKSANKYIANIEGKCWKCGENAFEHTKLKNCVGCKKRFYTCSKLRQHQWYCEGFKKMHLELFASAEKIFKCHLCRFYFFKKEDSIEHMILRHSVRSDVPIPGCAVCEKCKDLISYEDDHVCESKRYVTTCGACKKRVTESSAAFHQIEGNVTCSVCKLKIVNSCSTHLHALRHTMNYGLAYKCLTCNFFIIFDLEQIQKHKMFYHSNRDFDYDLISVPKTIVGRLKSMPAKHDSPVDSQINTLLLPHDTQDMVNDRDDDVIIIDKVPEVIVIPSDDTPNDDLPCVIANIKSEPLEIELQTSKTKHTVTPENYFECKTMVIQIPKDTKDVLECHSDGNRINNDKVLGIEEIKREPNSELNVAMESTFGILSTQSMTTNNVNTINNKGVGRPADISDNLEQITPKESEVSDPLKVEKNVETFVEIDIPWDAVPIKEEADPEMDLKLSDIRSLYHVDVNVGENEVYVKREINEFDLTGQSENLHQDNSAYDSHFITITPNVTLNTDANSDDEGNQTHRKKGKFKGHMRLHECLPVYKCEICNRTFSDSSNYSTVKVHNSQILICDICKKKFNNKAYFAKHIKRRTLCRKKMAKWAEDTTYKFVQEFVKYECLYNCKDPNYKVKGARNAALLKLSKAMNIPGFGTNEAYTKMRNLKSTYLQEVKKIKQRTKSRAGTVYNPQIKWFTLLDDAIKAVNVQCNDSGSNMENSSTIEADRVQTASYAVPKTKYKKLKRKSEDELMQLVVNCLRQKLDEYENWAASCAADLKKMEPTQRIFAKSAIAAIIMEGQLGLLHRNSVEINTPLVTITPSPTYTRSTPTPTNYKSTPSPRYSELPEELPHYQQNMDNSQLKNDANDMSQYIKINK